MGHCVPARTGQSGAGRAEGGGQPCPPGQLGEGGKTRREKPANKPCGWVGWGALEGPGARKPSWGDQARHRGAGGLLGDTPKFSCIIYADSGLPAQLVSACLLRGAEGTDPEGQGCLPWGSLPWG